MAGGGRVSADVGVRAFPGRAGVEHVGRMYAMALDVIVGMFRRPFQWTEFLEQAWFIAKVSTLPTMLFSIPFGATISLLLYQLLDQFGAGSATGAGGVLAITQQAAPIVTALLISGAGGSAIAADLGARTIREEIDAMKVLGIDPIRRLVVPRVLGMMFIAAVLNGLASVVGVAGGYVFNVMIQGGTPGAYISSFNLLAQSTDIMVSELKAVVFGFVAGVVAAYRGLNPPPGPKGVGDAVNQTVVISFMLVYFINLVMTQLYLFIVPAKGQ